MTGGSWAHRTTAVTPTLGIASELGAVLTLVRSTLTSIKSLRKHLEDGSPSLHVLGDYYVGNTDSSRTNQESHRAIPGLMYGGLTGSRIPGWEPEPGTEEHRWRTMMLTPNAVEEFKAACRWLRRQPRTSHVNRKSGSSYGLKELAEFAEDCYISNGMFIAAAIALGFKWKQIAYSPNAFFNILRTAWPRPGEHPEGMWRRSGWPTPGTLGQR
jgi:hypothetical protein